MHRLTIISRRLAIAIVVATGASIGVGYAASLGLGSNQLHAWSQTPDKGDVQSDVGDRGRHLCPAGASDSTAGGAATTLTISPLAGAQDYAFIRFDLSGCSLPTTAGADSATLTVFVTTNGNDTDLALPCLLELELVDPDVERRQRTHDRLDGDNELLRELRTARQR